MEEGWEWWKRGGNGGQSSRVETSNVTGPNDGFHTAEEVSHFNLRR